MTVIAVDVMSGERGALECIRGALLAAAAEPDLRLLVGLAAAFDGRVEGFAALLEDLAALGRRFVGPLTAFTRPFAEILAGFTARLRSVEQRNRRAAHRAEHEREKNKICAA